MPDSIPAVGAEIKPPNTLGQFSNVLGLKQQMLGIQQAQAGVQTAQATAQQAQQKNQELTALHNFTMSAMRDPKYRNADGSLNVQKFQDGAEAIAPTYGQAYIAQATQNANEGIQNRKALLDLSNAQRKTAGGYFAAVAADPTATHSTFIDAVEQARSVSQDPNYQRSLDSLLMTLPSTRSMEQPQATAALRQFARNVALAVGSPEAAQSAPGGPMIQTRGGLQQTQTNIQSPLGVGPVGAPIQNAPPPSYQVNPLTGAPEQVSPAGVASPITPAGAQPPNQGNAPGMPAPNQGSNPQANTWNPSPGQAQYVQQQAALWTARVAAANKSASQYQTSADALTRIEGLLNQPGVWTGSAFSKFQDLKNLVAPLGIDVTNATNANEVVKNIARYASSAAAEVGDTDAARSLQEQGLPNTHINKQALMDITRQSLAAVTASRDLATLVSSAPSWQEARNRELAFRQIPDVIEALELHQIGQMQGSVAEKNAAVKEFIERNKLSGAKLQKSWQMYGQLMSSMQPPSGGQ